MRESQGPLPDALFSLNNLQVLHFDRNAINGTIPRNVALLNRLETFVAGDNQLSGTIPEEMFFVRTLFR